MLRGAWYPGDVAVTDGYIERVGTVEAEPGDRTIDCRGGIITAGLINAHHHVGQWMTRGQDTASGLSAWLRHLYPLWGAMDVDDVRSAALVGFVELARSGCTTSVDHHYVVPGSDDRCFDAIADAARTVGIRLFLARGAIDIGISEGGLAPDDLVEDRDAALASMESVANRLHDDEAVWVALAPNSPHSASLGLMRDAADLADRLGLRLHTHLAETAAVAAMYRERFGRTPVELLDDLGWLSPRSWVAHGTHLDEDEIRQAGQAGLGVAHCPSGNARLGTGICPVVDLSNAGAPVGLGVDGGAVNETGVLFPELRQALYFARLRARDPAIFSPQAALDLGTVGGARCLGLDDRLGRLDVGMEADLVVWPAHDLHDFADPIAALVLGANRSALHVLVRGRLIIVDGESPTVDVGSAHRDLARRASRLREQTRPSPL